MGRFTAIILDLDDTLYPEHEYVLSGFRAAAQWIGRERNVRADDCAAGLTALFDRGVRQRTFDTWLEEAGLPVTLSPGMVRAYREHVPAITLHADVMPFLSECRERGVSLGLLSDGYLDVQRRKLDALGIATWFQSVVFSDSFGRDCWKPSPVPFQAALAQLSAVAGDAVYVGDNPAKDFLGARGAGLKSVRVRRPGGVYHDLEPARPEAAADAEVVSLADLPRTLELIH